MDDKNDTLSSGTIARALQARRRAAMKKMAAGRALIKEGQELERVGAIEMSDVEAFERVYKVLPSTEAEIQALENENLSWPPTGGATVAVRLLADLPKDTTGATISNSHINSTTNSEGSPCLEASIAVGHKTQRDQVISTCMHMLAGGCWRTTEELLAGLNARGVQLTASNPLQRVSQILSTTRQFRNRRGHGWSLDESALTPDSLLEDAPRELEDSLRTRARRLVNQDDNSAS
jgi:hypothetical protein